MASNIDLSSTRKKNVNFVPIPCFHDPKINYMEKEVGKEEIDVTRSSSFSHNVFLPYRSRIFFFNFTHIEMSANSSNLDDSKILSSSKG